MMNRFQIVREVDAHRFLETFLVSAVTAVISIRVYLELTHYPKVGGGHLHIAHMLWGGLLLMLAVVLLLAFLGKRVKMTAAVVGGLGFGTFVDELGKFITSDNDYFYQPTIAIIYIIFVVLMLAFRGIERRRALSPDELLVNGAEMVTEVLLDRASEQEVARALFLLHHSSAQQEVAHALEQAVLHAARAPDCEPTIPVRLMRRLRQAYRRLAAWDWFQRALVGLFVARAILFVGSYGAGLLVNREAFLDSASASFASSAVFVASTLSSLMVVIGVVVLRRSTLTACLWFKRAVLVSIFFGQVFAFVTLQLGALIGLLGDVVLLAGLNFMLDEERAALQSTLLAAHADSTAAQAGSLKYAR